MAIQASEILSRARGLLTDNDDTKRWSDADLLSYLSDGQRVIAAVKPDAAQKIAVITCASGTRQSLPADGVALMSVIRNMLPDGVTPSRAVRIVRRDIMDDGNPDWHSGPKALTIQNYIYDPQDSLHFFVYPPSNGASKLEINYNFSPAELDAPTDALELPDIYQTPLLDYVMFRAHMKESDFAAGQQTANLYLSSFATFLQTTQAAQLASNANLDTIPFNPDQKGTAK